MAHDVFLSFSSRDKSVADAVCHGLEARGVRCWVAGRDIRPGQNWGGAIVEAIADSVVMVLIFSDDANRSAQVLREVERGVSKGVTVIPFRIEDVVPSTDFEYYLSAPHWLDAFSPPLDANIARLATAVRGFMKVPATPKIDTDNGAMRDEAETPLDQRASEMPPRNAGLGSRPDAEPTADRSGTDAKIEANQAPTVSSGRHAFNSMGDNQPARLIVASVGVLFAAALGLIMFWPKTSTRDLPATTATVDSTGSAALVLPPLDTAVREIESGTKLERPVAAPSREVDAASVARTGEAPAYFDFQVEKPAVMISQRLEYPERLRSARIEGVVMAQFIVGGAGTAEMNSFKILWTKSEADSELAALFSKAVRDALAAAAFQPAEVGGQKVRQLVHQEFRFALNR